MTMGQGVWHTLVYRSWAAPVLMRFVLGKVPVRNTSGHPTFCLFLDGTNLLFLYKLYFWQDYKTLCWWKTFQWAAGIIQQTTHSPYEKNSQLFIDLPEHMTVCSRQIWLRSQELGWRHLRKFSWGNCSHNTQSGNNFVGWAACSLKMMTINLSGTVLGTIMWSLLSPRNCNVVAIVIDELLWGQGMINDTGRLLLTSTGSADETPR